MNQPSEPFPVRFVAEAYFFLMLKRCGKCGRGPLEAAESRSEFAESTPCRRIVTACGSCGERREFVFDTSLCPDSLDNVQAADFTRSTAGPSRLIDVAQWLTLFHMILRASNAQSDRAESRRLGFEAAQCLHEALRFYAEGDELPGRDTFFSEEAFLRSRLHAEQFARARLLAYRDKLPSLDAMRSRLERDSHQPRRADPWWKRVFRRKDG